MPAGMCRIFYQDIQFLITLCSNLSMMFSFTLFIICCAFICTRLAVAAKRTSVVLTMLCRDEDVNLKANLPSWLPVIDYFVFVMDNRTTDGSVSTIKSILGNANKKYNLAYNNFTGFGAARTLGLTAAWDHFPDATHVMISDPDWSPILKTINLLELDEKIDVFRFTIYDAPRNGQLNKRKMDWLLRHRKGLSMKFHMHEVLSIGEYTVKHINWEVREVEKQGTWHTTVGHSSSVSADRYKFDLQLLYRDLDMYGHDPHPHYYLGVTHENYATKMAPVLGVHHPEVRENTDSAIEFFTKRVTSVYNDELLEQRWGALIELGNIYTSLKRDDLKAIYWLNMCREYQPNQVACSLLLCQLYIRLGQLNPALKALDLVLTTERGADNRLSEQLGTWECDVPAMAADVLSKKAQAQQGLSAGEAMHFFVLLQMAKNPSCDKHKLVFNRPLRALLNAAVGAPPGVDYFEAPFNFCASEVLQQHLTTTRYTVHSCDAYRAALAQKNKCNIFTATAPPAYEEYQSGAFGRYFIGAAILPDIIHHAFQGHAATFLNPTTPVPQGAPLLRFLFAEHFHPEMVFNLLGQLQRQAVQDYEVMVVSADAKKMEAIKMRLAGCRNEVRSDQVAKVKFMTKSLSVFVAKAKDKYNYIEYNAGLSKSQDPETELAILSGLLVDGTGVIGLTYFARNHHVTRLRELVDTRAPLHMVPFSLEASRTVRNYLDQHRLEFLNQDRELMVHLGGEVEESSFALYKASQQQSRVHWQVFSQSEVEGLCSTVGLKIASWLPTAYARPFEEIQHYEVQRYRAMGLSQEQYVQEIMPNFRYTSYLVKQQMPSYPSSSGNSTSAAVLGRRKLTSEIFQQRMGLGVPSFASQLLVIDRVGYLSHTFKNMERLAEQQQSTSLEFNHYALPGESRMGFVVSPAIAPCLPQLSARPSLQSLHDINRRFAAQQRRDFDEVEAQELLISIISHLEKLNMLNIEHDAAVAGKNKSQSTSRVSKIQTMADRQREKAQKYTEFDEESAEGNTVKIGGLNVRAAKKPQLPDLPSGNGVGANKERSTESARKPSKKSISSDPATLAAAGIKEPPIAVSGEHVSTCATEEAGFRIEEQVSRMRALGYPDETIEDLLEVSLDSIEPAAEPDITTSKAAFPASTGEFPSVMHKPIVQTTVTDLKAVDIAVDGGSQQQATQQETGRTAKGIIDLLTRFTQHRSGQQTATTTSAHSPESTQSSDTSSLPAAESRSSEVVDTETLVQKNENSGLIIGGGLKLPAKKTRPKATSFAGKQEQTIMTSAQDSQRTTATTTASRSQQQKDSFGVRADQIKFPPVQTEIALLNSPRSFKCIDKSAISTTEFSACQESKVLRRKTAHLAATSARKVEFDRAQLEYILAQQSAVSLTPAAIESTKRGYSAVASFLKESALDNAYKVVRLSTYSSLQGSSEYLNRVLHIARDPVIGAGHLVHRGAMEYLHSIRREIEAHDFLVVDVILQDAAMAQLASLLLSSTVWFDSTNGAAFASHHDEGLVFKSVQSVAQEIARALSEPSKPLAVSGYYTIAMGLQHQAYSPVFIANKDDINVVLWLSPSAASIEADQQLDTTDAAAGRDGLRIYNEASTGKIFSQGVSVYPSAHSDFLSRSSSLAIDLSTRCNATNSEFVPRSPNRLVVVRSKKLCTLLTPGLQQQQSAASFEQTTMIALIMVLSPPA